jgi:hypothetical protein
MTCIERAGDYTGAQQFGVLRRNSGCGVAAAELVQSCDSLGAAIAGAIETAKLGPPTPGLRDRWGEWHFMEDLTPTLQWVRVGSKTWGRRYDNYGGKHTRLLPPSRQVYPMCPIARETLYHDGIAWWLVIEEAWGAPCLDLDIVERRAALDAITSDTLEELEASARWRVGRCYQYTSDNGRGWAEGRGLDEELATAAAIKAMPGVFSVLDHAGESGKTYDGGSYDFWRVYTRTGDGDYAVEYRTSAGFAYCRVCGQFQECERCADYYPEDQECYADREVVSAEEAAAIYANAKSAGTIMSE